MSYGDQTAKAGGCCSSSTITTATTATNSVASTELKLYQAFIFSVPIFFTFVLLLFFYLFYLRRRRVDWSSLRMRSSLPDIISDGSRAELGLKKELREMLPIIIYKESFSIRDTQCSVCLGDYQAEDRLQQIPACGHTFHMDCIDHWLSTHSTCPLCRLSLLPSSKASLCSQGPAENGDQTSLGPSLLAREETRATRLSEPSNGDERTVEDGAEEESMGCQCVSNGV